MGRPARSAFPPEILALAIPVMAGAAYLAVAGAPRPYLIVNGIALCLAAALAVLLRGPADLRLQRGLALLLILLLFVPLLTGPHLNGIARWLPLGPVTLHAGALVAPPLAVLAARDADLAAPLLLAALFAALLQPDAATGFAVTFGAVGLYHAAPDWKTGMVCVVGFLASIVMVLRGELPAQPFVERVLVEAAIAAPLLALVLALALLAAYLLIVARVALPRPERFALAGTLFGFIAMSLLNNYPTPLVGFGAAPILGYGLALGLRRTTPA
jgi:hypothetical protein